MVLEVVSLPIRMVACHATKGTLDGRWRSRRPTGNKVWPVVDQVADFSINFFHLRPLVTVVLHLAFLWHHKVVLFDLVVDDGRRRNRMVTSGLTVAAQFGIGKKEAAAPKSRAIKLLSSIVMVLEDMGEHAVIGAEQTSTCETATAADVLKRNGH
jgi:hypothetical protein